MVINGDEWWLMVIYPLVNIQIPMENGPFIVDLPSYKMVDLSIFFLIFMFTRPGNSPMISIITPHTNFRTDDLTIDPAGRLCTRVGFLAAANMTDDPFSELPVDGIVGLSLEGLWLGMMGWWDDGMMGWWGDVKSCII